MTNCCLRRCRRHHLRCVLRGPCCAFDLPLFAPAPQCPCWQRWSSVFFGCAVHVHIVFGIERPSSCSSVSTSPDPTCTALVALQLPGAGQGRGTCTPLGLRTCLALLAVPLRYRLARAAENARTMEMNPCACNSKVLTKELHEWPLVGVR